MRVACTVGAGYPTYEPGFFFIETFALQPNPTPVTGDTVVLVPTAAVTTTSEFNPPPRNGTTLG